MQDLDAEQYALMSDLSGNMMAGGRLLSSPFPGHYVEIDFISASLR